MYHIASLSKPSIQGLTDIQSRGANHTRAFTLALGYVLGASLSIPNTDIGDAVGYYRMTHALSVRGVMSKLNELVPFDIRAAEDDVRGFFQFRVNQINAPLTPLALNSNSSLVDFFSISACFSKDAIKAIEENGGDVTRWIATLRPICDDLRKVSQCETVADVGTGNPEDRIPS